MMRAVVLVFAIAAAALGCRRHEAPGAQQSAPVAPKPELPAPDPQDIRDLLSTDEHVQERAAQTLYGRRMTPELAEAVRAAKPVRSLGIADINCLRARLPGREGFDVALNEYPFLFPPPPDLNYDRPLTDYRREEKCFIETLAERGDLDPDAAREVLARFALFNTHPEANAALRKLPPAITLPRALRTAYNSHLGTYHIRYYAVVTADAVGGLDNFPEFFETALRDDDPQLRKAVANFLAGAPKSKGAGAVLARVAVQDPPDPNFVYWLWRRDQKFGDVGDPLFAIAADTNEEVETRKKALELLAAKKDKRYIARLQPLKHSPIAAIRIYADSAITQLEQLP